MQSNSAVAGADHGGQRRRYTTMKHSAAEGSRGRHLFDASEGLNRLH